MEYLVISFQLTKNLTTGISALDQDFFLDYKMDIYELNIIEDLEEEEDMPVVRGIRQYIVQERRSNYMFEMVSDSDFRRHFRFTKEGVRRIVSLLGKKF